MTERFFLFDGYFCYIFSLTFAVSWFYEIESVASDLIEDREEDTTVLAGDFEVTLEDGEYFLPF